MANYCIPKEFVSRLKTSIKELSDGGQISALTEMSRSDRVSFFKKTLSENDSIRLNTAFEKAVGQKKLNALKNWVRDNIDIKYRKDETMFLMKRYKNLEEVDNFVNTRMELLAEQKLGVALTDEQVTKMTKLGEEFFEESKKLGDNLGKMEFEKENLAWGKKYKEISDYRDSLMPQSWWKALVNNLGRASMLASIKTPFLNIESNTINAISEAIVRRWTTSKLYADIPRDLPVEYEKFARKMFNRTGVDFTRMIDLDDTVTGMGKIVGEETARLPFAWGRAYTDFIFNKTLSTPDVAFSAFAFADSLSLNASKAAKGDKDLAEKLFRDATNVNAVGDAKVLRDVAISDARFATYTNDSFSSKLSEELRKILNNVGGLGDVLMPFVKTPGNVAELAIDYAGFGFVKGTFSVSKSLIKNGKIDREAMRSAMRNVGRAGVGMTAGYLMASQFDPEHFIGVYDPSRVKINQLSNTAYNAILLKTPFGDRWVNVDYLGPLAAPFVSFMYAKKYGGPAGYVSGATSAYLSQLPFVDAKSVFDGLDILTDPENTGQIVKLGERLQGNMIDTFVSRVTPGIMYDIARATDSVQRDTRQEKFIIDTPLFDINFGKLINKIPFLRMNLPIKYDTLGRVMLESSPIESMLFGARVRNARTDAVTVEILRLRDSGNTPNVKDLRFSNSSKVEELKTKLGNDKFIDVTIEYGKDIADAFEKKMKSARYKRASDEQKDEMLSDISTDEYKKMLRRNGIKP